MNCPWVRDAGGIPCVTESHHPFYYLGASQTDALPAILASSSPPLCFSPSLRAWTLLWTVSRVSYWCNWKCFVIAFSQILMDVKLNEVWVLVIRVSLCEIYHQRLKRLQGTIKAPPPSTSQWTVHYYSLKQKAFNMSSFPCEKEKKLYIHILMTVEKMRKWISCWGFTANSPHAIKYEFEKCRQHIKNNLGYKFIRNDKKE